MGPARPGLARPVRANLTRRLIAEAPRYDAVVLWGSHRSEQAAAFALSRVRRRVPVILQSTTWKTGDNTADRLASRAIVRLLAGPSTHFCVLTRAELESFPWTWRVAPGRVHLTPFYYGLSEAELRRRPQRTGPSSPAATRCATTAR